MERIHGRKAAVFCIGLLAGSLYSGVVQNSFAEPSSEVAVSAMSDRAMLTQLARYEERIVDSSKIAAKSQTPMYVSVQDASQAGKQLQELQSKNDVLKRQQDELIRYIRKLKQKISVLEQPVAPGPNSVSQDPRLPLAIEERDLARRQLEKLKEELKSVSVVTTERDKLQSELVELERSLGEAKQERDSLKQELQKLKDISTTSAEELNETKRHFSRGVEELRACQETLDTQKQALSKAEELSANLKTVSSVAEQKTSESKACFEQLSISQKLIARIPELEKELLAAKNEVMLKQTAQELLGDRRPAVGRSRNSNSRAQAEAAAKTDPVRSVYARPQQMPPAVPLSSDVLNSDVLVIEVTGSRVSLRVGPGQEHSAIMDVQKGNRLTVEAREGDWFRVNAPTGGRAYIHADYVQVVEGAAGSRAAVPLSTRLENPNNQTASSFIQPPQPQRPPLRAGADLGAEGQLEPFGEVKVGRKPSAGGVDSAAFKKLKQKFQDGAAE